MHHFLTEHQMVHEAWSPLGQVTETIMGNEVLTSLAQQYHKTPAQISLRFLIQEGVVVIPKATHLKRQLLVCNIPNFARLFVMTSASICACNPTKLRA